MELVKKKLCDIKPYEKNARKNDDAVRYVVESIKQCEYVAPIIVDENNVILAGHTRWKALKKLGYEEAEVIVKSGLTEEQKKKYRLLDNKTNEFAEWDFDLLEEELDGLDFGDLDLDWGLPINITPYAEDEDVIPNGDFSNNTIAKLGDIYQLGEHRLMCGDSTMIDDVEKLMAKNKADLLFTDPPYNVSMESKSKDVLKSNNYAHIENDDLSENDFKEFLRLVFGNANLMLKDDASYYVFSCQGGDSEMMMMMMMRESGIKCRHQIIWVKDAPVFSMGRLDYDYKHEPILYGWKEKHNFYREGQQDKSVWQFDRTENKLHPTMKPVALIENALLNSTKQNDIVLDLFGGSGSTLIACEKQKRKCFMMEFDPHYVDVIVKRWEDFTGQKAVLVEG